jgi:hypothetical protein
MVSFVADREITAGAACCDPDPVTRISPFFREQVAQIAEKTKNCLGNSRLAENILSRANHL